MRLRAALTFPISARLFACWRNHFAMSRSRDMDSFSVRFLVIGALIEHPLSFLW